MIKKRRRFKQTKTLAERLIEYSMQLRQQAQKLPPGAEQALLWRRVRETEAAIRFDRLLSG